MCAPKPGPPLAPPMNPSHGARKGRSASGQVRPRSGVARRPRRAMPMASGMIQASVRQTGSRRWHVRIRVRCDADGRIVVRSLPVAVGAESSGKTSQQIVAAAAPLASVSR